MNLGTKKGSSSSRDRITNASASESSDTSTPRSNCSSTSDKDTTSATPSVLQASGTLDEKIDEASKSSKSDISVSATPPMSQNRKISKFSKTKVIVDDFELPTPKRATPRMSNAHPPLSLQQVSSLNVPDDIDMVRAMAASPPMPPPAKHNASEFVEFFSRILIWFERSQCVRNSSTWLWETIFERNCPFALFSKYKIE